MKLFAVFAAALMCASAQDKMYVTPMGVGPEVGALLPPGVYIKGAAPITILVNIMSEDPHRVTVKYHKPDGTVGEVTKQTDPPQVNVAGVAAWFNISPDDFIEASAQKYVPHGTPIVANKMGGPFTAMVVDPRADQVHWMDVKIEGPARTGHDLGMKTFFFGPFNHVYLHPDTKAVHIGINTKIIVDIHPPDGNEFESHPALESSYSGDLGLKRWRTGFFPSLGTAEKVTH